MVNMDNEIEMKRIAELFGQLESEGVVRLRVEPDDIYHPDNLFGDVYNPEANPDIPPERLKRAEQEEIDRVNREGVWGLITEYYDHYSGKWTEAFSCWGFIGDDWKDSGYDTDAKDMAITEYYSQPYLTVCDLIS
jgi:hypothetical protein